MKENLLTKKQRNSLYIKLKKEISATLHDVQGNYHSQQWLNAGERFRHASAGTNKCLARTPRLQGTQTDLFFQFNSDDVEFLREDE